jgi:uridine kinase
MYDQCNEEGNQCNLMDGIVDHKTDGHAVVPADMYINHGSNRQVRKTTIGWHLCVEWKDGTTSWEHLTDIKEINPVEVAQYAIENDLQDKPVFVWWVPHVLKKWHRIISSVTKRYLKRNHKSGIEIPTT